MWQLCELLLTDVYVYVVAPDRPGDLSFIVTTPSSVQVSWTRPSPRPNGIVLLYELSYYQDFHVDGESSYMGGIKTLTTEFAAVIRNSAE